MSKFAIYQVLPRLFGNYKTTNKKHGTIDENGCGKFNSFKLKALTEIKSLGVTHIWYTGVIEHATQTDYSDFNIKKDHPSIVKGKAGSAYAIKDYYDVDPDLAVNVENRMGEFENLVKRTHKSRLKVIIDFVPNHVAREYASDVRPEGVRDLGADDLPYDAFHKNNNFYYLPGQHFHPDFDIAGYHEYPAKATGNNQFTASPGRNDWYETVKLNYGVDYYHNNQTYFDPVPDTWLKMKDILFFWAEKKIDGFRCDMAEMVPVEFWHWAIHEVKIKFPEIIFIAEVYHPQEYRNYIFYGGFDYLYDKVGMYDELRNIVCHGSPATGITNSWLNLSGIEDNMLFFLENHDEQRIASAFFAGNPDFARPAMIVTATLNRAPVMIYAGQELGEQGMDEEGFSGLDGRTTIFDYWGVKSLQDWANKGKFDGAFLSDKQKELRNFYQKLLHITLNETAIRLGVKYDLQYANLHHSDYNPNKQFAFFRQFDNELLLIVVNFEDKPVEIGLNIPQEALDYLKIQESSIFECVDLMKEVVVDGGLKINSNQKIMISIEATNGKIIKLKELKLF
jgi:glycosidase